MSKAFDFAKCIEGSGTFDGFMLPESNAAAAGVPGELRVNNGIVERWSSTDFVPRWRPIDEEPVTGPEVHFLVIAGGGSGGGVGQAGGGGAGGYRTSWGTGNVSGRLSPAENPFGVTLGQAYDITVGAGGAGVANAVGNKGSDSIFATITSIGGGPGSPHAFSSINHSGGSGGGTGTNHTGTINVAGTTNQGFDGGLGQGTAGAASGYTTDYNGGGGGGAGGAGGNPVANDGASSFGGVGLSSDITGTAVFRGGGGAGGQGYGSSRPLAPGGNGGGGSAQGGGTGGSGTANTGGGGAGASSYSSAFAGGSGGSGVIILRTLSNIIATFSSGVTVNGTTTTGNQAVTGTLVGGTDRYWEITAANGATVTFSI